MPLLLLVLVIPFLVVVFLALVVGMVGLLLAFLKLLLPVIVVVLIVKWLLTPHPQHRTFQRPNPADAGHNKSKRERKSLHHVEVKNEHSWDDF